MTRNLKPCLESGCNHPRMTRMLKGRIAYREYCAEHHRQHERNRRREKNGCPLPENAPALPIGRYILFDLPNHMVYVVRGKFRSFQSFPRPDVTPHTIEVLKRRNFEVRFSA